MRGRPILEWCLFVGVWLVLLVPLAMLTGRRVTAAASPPASAAVRQLVWTTLRLSQQPRRFILSQQGRVLWEDAAPSGLVAERAVEMDLPSRSVELVLAVEWDESGPGKAVELVLEPDALEAAARTVWCRMDRLEEVMRFQW